MNLNDYLQNPCGSSSIPFWKMQRIKTPENMKIIHHRSFTSDLLNYYNEKCYFRLKHDLINICSPELINGYTFELITDNQFPALAELINLSYRSLGLEVDVNQIISWTKTEVYQSNLWISIYHGNRMVGSIIADFDSIAKEATIEWLQVLPKYRHKGLATMAVNEFLNRIKDKADFATVYGELDNQTNPEIVYRRCGFTGNDVWHVLFKK